MATATYTAQTGSDLKELRKKVQVGIHEAAEFSTPEMQLVQRCKPLKVDYSQREVTVELRLIKPTGWSSIPEGGKEARPSMPTAVTATLSMIMLNKRATMTVMSEIVARNQGSRAALMADLKWYGMNFTDALGRKIGEQLFYGFSTGTVAKVATISGAPAYTLKDLFGVSGLGSTSHNRRVVDLFVGAAADPNRDYIAWATPAGPTFLETDAVLSTARATNTLTVDAAYGTDDIDDLVLFANNLENTTLASGTERNLCPVGLLDGLTSTSVHSVSGSTYGLWNPSLSDTAGGRFTPIKYKKGKTAIEQIGGGKLTTLILANGVYYDLLAQQEAGLRFTDPFHLEIDGDATAKGVEIFTSKNVPDGYAIGLDKNDSVFKWTITDTPSGQMSLDDLYKTQDDSFSLLSENYPFAMVWLNRANTFYYSALTQA